MSNPRPSTHYGEPSSSTNQHDRSVSRAVHESLLKSPEEEAVADSRNLQGAAKREVDMIDGLKSNADVIDKILDMISELMYRLRQVEEAQDKSEVDKKSSGGGCGLNCANNSFTL